MLGAKRLQPQSRPTGRAPRGRAADDGNDELPAERRRYNHALQRTVPGRNEARVLRARMFSNRRPRADPSLRGR
jgi:hypothetical protein